MTHPAEMHFADSEVALVEARAASLRVRFSVASGYGRSDDGSASVGGPLEAGYWRAVELVLAEAAWTGPLDDGIGSLVDGELAVDGRSMRRLPLPCFLQADAAGGVALVLRFRNGVRIAATGRSVELLHRGGAGFLPSLAC